MIDQGYIIIPYLLLKCFCFMAASPTNMTTVCVMSKYYFLVRSVNCKLPTAPKSREDPSMIPASISTVPLSVKLLPYPALVSPAFSNTIVAEHAASKAEPPWRSTSTPILQASAHMDQYSCVLASECCPAPMCTPINPSLMAPVMQ